MDVNGLVCGYCAQGIEKTLKGLSATEAVFVSLEHRLVAVVLWSVAAACTAVTAIFAFVAPALLRNRRAVVGHLFLTDWRCA